MKFKQKKNFEPITIILETEYEARHLLGLVDKIERSQLGRKIPITQDEFAVAKEISDAFTNCVVQVN